MTTGYSHLEDIFISTSWLNLVRSSTGRLSQQLIIVSGESGRSGAVCLQQISPTSTQLDNEPQDLLN